LARRNRCKSTAGPKNKLKPDGLNKKISISFVSLVSFISSLGGLVLLLLLQESQWNRDKIVLFAETQDSLALEEGGWR